MLKRKLGHRSYSEALKRGTSPSYTPPRVRTPHRVRSKKDEVRKLARSLEASENKNSNLAKELRDLQQEKSTLEGQHQEVLGQLERLKATEKVRRAELKGAQKYCNNLSAKHKDLGIKYEEIAATNRSKDQEIKFLKEANLKISTELETRSAQLNKFTGEIARQNQRVNTSAIRDDEYFAREFADLAKDIRNWSFTHFFPRSETFVPTVVTEDVRNAIREITGVADMPKIFKNRPTSRRVVAALLANQLRKWVFEPPLLGLLHREVLVFDSMAEKTVAEKSTWLSQTISLFVKSEQFEKRLGGQVSLLSGELGRMLGGLAMQESSESKASKRGQKLQAIVQRAANLAVEVSQQPHYFRFFVPPPGYNFEPHWMEDVEAGVLLEEADPGTCKDDCTVSFSVFPCVCRQEHVEGENEPQNVVVNKAWVTVETGDNHTAVRKDAGMVGEQERADAEFGEGHPGGRNADGEEPGAQGGEGRENSQHSDMPVTGAISGGLDSPESQADGEELGAQGGEGSENSQHSDMPVTGATSVGLDSRESQARASQEAGLAADVDAARERMENVPIK
ncbi:hypothetical protein C7212DRAFT_357316 [Tuber magnatum]|uniref:Uncharacterized protein n=1 Tax=Tuber magnatum TaxID=42249 RepID=A0A317SRX1_9PEZI|nr:hypothetical protein C7212DRAFT_357316 [Tuber magnatum]